jgi:hypothetical protein
VLTDSRALAAASNNADWCDLVCRASDRNTSIADGVWASHRRSPPFYPDAITLSPTATADAVLDRVERGDGCSVKDSFASLDLGPLGFRVLFDAEWIHLSTASTTVDSLEWSPASEFPAWRHIPSSVFDDPSVAALVARSGDDIVAGVIANRSDDVVGVSNMDGHGSRTGRGLVERRWRGLHSLSRPAPSWATSRARHSTPRTAPALSASDHCASGWPSHAGAL